MNNLNIKDDNFIGGFEGSLEGRIKRLEIKSNSFTKWKIIFTLYMIASFGIIIFLFYAIFNYMTG